MNYTNQHPTLQHYRTNAIEEEKRKKANERQTGTRCAKIALGDASERSIQRVVRSFDRHRAGARG